MTESASGPTEQRLNREEALRLARSATADPRLLELLATQDTCDEELWRLLLTNPKTPLAALMAMAEKASTSFVNLFLEERTLIRRHPVVGYALLKNSALTEDDHEKLHLILQEEIKDEERRKKSLLQTIKEMNIGQKLTLAKKGNKEARMILIKDPNELIALEVVNSPRITDPEILSIAQMRDVSEKILRAIATNKRYRSMKTVVMSLLHNPKTPVGVSLGLGISGLSDRELEGLAKSRDIPAALSRAAKQVLDRRKQGPAQQAGH
jgi:hypothetical protein